MVKKDKIKPSGLKTTFDPPIKPRFFPGEVGAPMIRADLKVYKAHRLKIVNKKHVIDNRAPKFDIHNVYCDHRLLNNFANATIRKCRENMELMEKLNRIARMGGKVDCWLKQKPYNDPFDHEKKIAQIDKKEERRTIERANRRLVERLKAIKGVYSPEIFEREWKVLKAKIIEQSRFPWFKTIEECKLPSRGRFDRPRTRCFFDLEIAETRVPLGRLVFVLYNDYVPFVCANFEAYCRGHEIGDGTRLSYKRTPFHSIIAGYLCQGGDVTKFNGLGGTSIYEEPIGIEQDCSLTHFCSGILSTWNSDPRRLDSKFRLSFKPLKTLDRKNIVFGRVVEGLPNLLKVNAFGTRSGKPLQTIHVANCGIICNSNSTKPNQKKTPPKEGMKNRKVSSCAET